MAQFDDLSPSERNALKAIQRRINTANTKAAFENCFEQISFPEDNEKKFRAIEKMLDSATPDKPLKLRQLVDLAFKYFSASWGWGSVQEQGDAYALMASVMFRDSKVSSTSVEFPNGRVVHSHPAVFAEGAYSLLVQYEKTLPLESTSQILKTRQAMIVMMSLAGKYYSEEGSLNLWKSSQHRLIKVAESIDLKPDELLLYRLSFLAGSIRSPELLNRREIRDQCRKALRLFDGVTEATEKVEMIKSVAITIDAWQRIKTQRKQPASQSDRMPPWLRVFKRRCDKSLPAVRAAIASESISKVISKVFGDGS
jgi:hypothetical protein